MICPLTTGADAFVGTAGNDTFTSANGTLNVGDVVVDSITTDADTMSIAYTGATLASMGTISGVEKVALNADATGGTFTVTTAAGFSKGELTINSVRAGGATTAVVSKIGADAAVVAGTAVADLTVDNDAAISNVTVTGGTGATTVNQSNQKATNLTVNAAAGSSVDVEFGTSTNVVVTSGTGAVDVNNGSAAKVTGLTVNASKSTSTVDVDVADGSSNVSVTTGTGAVTVNTGVTAKVTGLKVDASKATSTVDVTVTKGSTVEVIATVDAGTITVDSTDAYSDTAGSTLTITADVADVASSITDFNTINATLLGSAGTLTLDDSVRALTVSAVTAAQTVSATTGPMKSATLNGAKAITLVMDTEDVGGTDVITVATDGTSANVLKFTTNDQDANVDLTNVATAVKIEFGVAMASSATGTFTVADGSTIKASTAQTAAVAIKGASAESTLNLDVSSANHTGSFVYTNAGVVNVSSTATSGNTNAVVVTVDADTDGNAGVINLTGSKQVTLSGSSDATKVTAVGFTGKLVATTSATLLDITGGSGADSITLADVNFTLDGGTGNDTLVAAGIDLSNNTATAVNFEILSLGTADMTVGKGFFAGTETINGTTGTLTIKGGTTGDTINASGFANALTQSVDGDGLLILDGGNGADILTGSSKNDALKGGSGADSLTGGEGQDHYIGSTGADTIAMTETDSVGDYVVVASVLDGSAVGTAGGTFSGFDVITGFATTVDKVVFDSAYANDGLVTTPLADGTVNAKFVVAGTAATLASDDLTADNYTNVDTVVRFLASAGTGFTADTSETDVVAVTLGTGLTAIYVVQTGAAAAVTAAEITLIGTVDATLVSGDIVVA